MKGPDNEDGMEYFDLTRRVLGEAGSEDPEALQRIRERLDEAMGSAVRRSPVAVVWRRILAAAAALAWVIGLVVVLSAIQDERAAPATAASELRRLSRIAATEGPLEPGPSEFFLIRWVELRTEGYTSIVEGWSFDRISRLLVSTWLASDGSAFRREEVMSSRFASVADRAAWLDAGRPDVELPRTDVFAPGEAPVEDVSRLPADPERLLDVLHSWRGEQAPIRNDEVFSLIGKLLAQGTAPPEVRAALLEVAARLPGVRLVGDVLDPLRRSGVAIAIQAPSELIRLVFDPVSAQILAIERFEPGAEETDAPVSWIAAFPAIVVDDAPRLDG